MNRIIACCLALSTVLAVPFIASGEQPDEQNSVNKTGSPKEEMKQPFTVLVVDPNGRPVSGALVGEGAGREGEVGGDWIFAGFVESGKWHPFITDANGKTQMFAENISRDSLALVARKESRKLVGLKPVSQKDVVDAFTNKSVMVISLEPECRVHGRLQSTGLEKLGHKLAWTNVQLEIDGRHVFECSSYGQEYEFFVPHGTYKIEGYGADTYSASRSFTVPAGSTDLDLEAIDLPPAEMAKLIGGPAPEIADVVAWKNSEPLKLADLHGKYVLLEFFGHWCGPCVYRMPKLFEIHDRFAKRGVTIIGIHVGLEDESIDSAEKLDTALAESRKELWAGRDLPFPVAMVASHRTKYAGSEQTGRSHAAADYGIRSYPSQVLIDPEGKVVGWFDEEEHSKLFENLPKAD